jgi:hypothetical protein
MKFAHSIIQDIYKLGTSKVEFLHKHKKGWSTSEQVGPKATLVDLVYIEELDEDKGVVLQT